MTAPDETPLPTTPLPPWVLPEAEPGRGWQQRQLPAVVHEALRGPGREAGWLEGLALTCWLAVLSRCVGEPLVRTAAVDPTGQLCCVTGPVGPMSWAEMSRSLRRSPLHGRPDSAVDVYSTAPGHPPADVPAADLLIQLDAGRGRLSLGYDTARVSHAAADRVIGYLIHALSAAVTAPAELVDLAGMLGVEERRHQLERLCGPRVSNGPDGFVTALRARVAAHPDRPAVHHRDRTLTYAELGRAADRLARHLRGHGVPAGQPVAVVSDRHLDWVVAMLGVLEAGRSTCPSGRTSRPPGWRIS